jgi:hypothetical protein
MTIAWQTDTAENGSVRYGRTERLGAEKAASGEARNQTVTLSGSVPAPGTSTGRGRGQALSASGVAFETAPPTAEPFRFVAIGDLGRATDAQLQIASRVDALRPDLAIVTGDIIYERGEAEKHHPAVLPRLPGDDLADSVLSDLGNHDVGTSSGQPYLDAFHLPAGPGHERYYSFDYSNAHFTCLEVTREDVEPDQEMRAWLDADLAATEKTWKFVFFHVPMVSNSGSHGDDPTIAAALDPILSARGVDLVFQVHNHFYSRSYPIRRGEPVAADQGPRYVNPGAPIYVVTGGGGQTLEPLGPRGREEAFDKSAYHVVSVNVFRNLLSLTAFEADGTVFDAMTVKKSVTTEPGTLALVPGAVVPESVDRRRVAPIPTEPAASIRVVVYDVAGRRVREIRTGEPFAAGTNTVPVGWPRSDGEGRSRRGVSRANRGGGPSREREVDPHLQAAVNGRAGPRPNEKRGRRILAPTPS